MHDSPRRTFLRIGATLGIVGVSGCVQYVEKNILKQNPYEAGTLIVINNHTVVHTVTITAAKKAEKTASNDSSPESKSRNIAEEQRKQINHIKPGDKKVVERFLAGESRYSINVYMDGKLMKTFKYQPKTMRRGTVVGHSLHVTITKGREIDWVVDTVE